jgi:hypothetical protein
MAGIYLLHEKIVGLVGEIRIKAMWKTCRKDMQYCYCPFLHVSYSTADLTVASL